MCDQPKERIRKPANSCKTKNHREKKSQWDNQTITNIIIFKQFLRWCQCGWSTNFLSVSFFSGLSPNNWRGDIIWFLELILFTNMRCVVKRIFFQDPDCDAYNHLQKSVRHSWHTVEVRKFCGDKYFFQCWFDKFIQQRFEIKK